VSFQTDSKELSFTDTSYDPEASLYDGLATLAMIGQLAIHDQLDQIPPPLLFVSLKAAVDDIQFGVAGLAASELADGMSAGH